MKKQMEKQMENVMEIGNSTIVIIEITHRIRSIAFVFGSAGA